MPARGRLDVWRPADVDVQRTSSDTARSAVDLYLFEGIFMGGQRQSSSIRQQREMSRKLKAAEKRAKRQNRTAEKPKDATEPATDR
jgi:hypothetical protein